MFTIPSHGGKNGIDLPTLALIQWDCSLGLKITPGPARIRQKLPDPVSSKMTGTSDINGGLLWFNGNIIELNGG